MKKIITVVSLIVLASCTERKDDYKKQYDNSLQGQQTEWARWAKWYESQQDKALIIVDDLLATKISGSEAARRLSKLWSDNTFPKIPTAIDSTQTPQP